MASIGWLVIGTNRYRDLAIRCLSTIRANYNGALSSRYLLFTDQPKACSHDWVETIRVEHEQFPGISLQRYRHFHRHASRLASCTYFFYVDADMEFVEVGDEILGKRVVVQHPPFVNTPAVDCPPPAGPRFRSSTRAPVSRTVFKGVRALSFCG